MIDIIREPQYEQMMRTVVEPGLEAMREEIDMPLSTGGTLHGEVYNRLDAERAVVILHGYTESAEKFRELAWYFITEGYSVFAMDHRGHGRSVREVEDLSLTHVDHFGDYLRGTICATCRSLWTMWCCRVWARPSSVCMVIPWAAH